MARANRRAQATADFLIVVAVVMIVFLSIVGMIQHKNNFTMREKAKMQAKAVCDRAAQEINSVHLAGDGTGKTFFLPQRLKENTNYNLLVHPKSHIVEIRWDSFGEDKHYTSPLITSNITGTLNNISGRVALFNNNGQITIG